MSGSPDSVPTPDDDELAELLEGALEEGLAEVADEQRAEIVAGVSSVVGLMNPIAGFVFWVSLKALTGERAISLLQRGGRRLDDYADDLDRSESAQWATAKGIETITSLLPSDHDIGSAAIAAAGGDPAFLLDLLDEYQTDGRARTEFEDAAVAVMRGELGDEGTDLREELRRAFGTDTADEAVAAFLETRDAMTADTVQETAESVEGIEMDVARAVEEIERATTGVEDLLEIELGKNGIERLDPVYFRHETSTRSIVDCWRTGFDIVDVYAGKAVARVDTNTDPIPDSTPDGRERPLVSEGIIEDLLAGENAAIAVLGEPGSGKSTICKAIATEWFRRQHGAVFYRGSDEANPFDTIEPIRTQLHREGRMPLVVIEDAVGSDANAVFELVRRFETDDVAFLLDARRNEWFTDRADLDPTDRNYRRNEENIDKRYVPPLDPNEFERIVRQFSEMADLSTTPDPERLQERVHGDYSEAASVGDEQGTTEGRAAIQADGDSEGVDEEISHRSRGVEVASEIAAEQAQPQAYRPGEMALLAHYLTLYASDPLDVDATTGMEGEAEKAHHYLRTEAESELAVDAGVLANLLNAARLPVDKGLFYALATGEAEPAEVATALTDLDGQILFGQTNDSAYRTRHETWSLLFLRAMPEIYGDEAKNRFDRVLNGLFTVDERRQGIEDYLDESTDFLERMRQDGADECETIVEKTIELIDQNFWTAQLLKSSNNSDVQLPNAVSSTMLLRWQRSLAEVYRQNGELSSAVIEYGKLASVGTTVENDEQFSGEVRSMAFTSLGHVASGRGDLRDAAHYHQRSLELQKEIGDKAGRATSLNNLGLVEQQRGHLDDAADYFQESISLKREIGSTLGEAKSLGGLGSVRLEQEQLPDAKELFIEAKEKFLSAGAVRDGLQPVADLTRTSVRMEEYSEAIDHAQFGLGVARNVEIREDEFRERLLGLYAEYVESASACYRYALNHVLGRDPETAWNSFEIAWARHDDVASDSEDYHIALAAGVLLVAHSELFGGHPDDLPPTDEILATAAGHREHLPGPTVAVLDYLFNDGTDVDHEELLAPMTDADSDSESSDLTLEEREQVACGILLRDLREH
jgi:tetratricopeptide (TPR) repeat protein/energy-coupling factor transporter ATP-binding protein EcfA2